MSRDANTWIKILHAVGVADTQAQAWAPHMSAVLVDDTFDGGDEELAQWCGQCFHESTMLTTMSENLNYTVQALTAKFGSRITAAQAQKVGRIDGVQHADQQAIANIIYGGAWGLENLGNKVDGDGWKYRGSGFIETTGFANFLRAEKKTDIPFSTNPDLMRTVGPAAIEAAVSWWHDNITTAMLSDALALRRRVNGKAALGLQECIVLTSKARAALTSFPSTSKD